MRQYNNNVPTKLINVFVRGNLFIWLSTCVRQTIPFQSMGLAMDSTLYTKQGQLKYISRWMDDYHLWLGLGFICMEHGGTILNKLNAMNGQLTFCILHCCGTNEVSGLELPLDFPSSLRYNGMFLTMNSSWSSSPKNKYYIIYLCYSILSKVLKKVLKHDF